MKIEEHKKLEKFTNEERRAIYEFIEYCERKEFNGHDLEDAFYEMLGIDRNELEKERQELLKHNRDISLNL
jgi:hypothetical protein